ncbi:cupin domain-containing protein [Litoreibacter roseus]|uniref:Cupin type-1 domain-containing protein n=1 Tax=Litoreibacter roseus TaxID=2601869 RepID=A0A6N6JA88_9RHOB|nr:cupin domain-containing protein [Litoreibacter roseus]GFE63153.1 hypothetical protein KIN_02270 [Litoreibacter roseus]
MKPVVMVALLAASSAFAQDRTEAIDLAAANHSASLFFRGVETARLVGDNREAGLYATHARLEAGATVAPHVHDVDITTVVTSGTAYVGTGEVYDEAALVAYPEGSYFVTPAGSPHFIGAIDGAFSILDHGVGPVVTTLVER